MMMSNGRQGAFFVVALAAHASGENARAWRQQQECAIINRRQSRLTVPIGDELRRLSSPPASGEHLTSSPALCNPSPVTSGQTGDSVGGSVGMALIHAAWLLAPQNWRPNLASRCNKTFSNVHFLMGNWLPTLTRSVPLAGGREDEGIDWVCRFDECFVKPICRPNRVSSVPALNSSIRPGNSTSGRGVEDHICGHRRTNQSSFHVGQLRSVQLVGSASNEADQRDWLLGACLLAPVVGLFHSIDPPRAILPHAYIPTDLPERLLVRLVGL
ncbi:unnamed protein product [Protopolystoma xenopodis]|uniref:Uncharacterized protein n=1 Tax=Protopolystoma xenopodis TaxID=117903 RepID=A0A3S5A238_9PLAT|nr:unnamed protein product [Protopolystoma xenopodis]